MVKFKNISKEFLFLKNDKYYEIDLNNMQNIQNVKERSKSNKKIVKIKKNSLRIYSLIGFLKNKLKNINILIF